MVKNNLSLMNIPLVIFDLVIINISYGLSFLMKFGSIVPNANWNAYMQIMPFMLLGTVLSFFLFNLYNGLIRKSIKDILYSLFLALVVTTLFIMGLAYLMEILAFPRSIVLIALLIEYVLFAALRIATLFVSKRVLGIRKVLLIGRSSSETMLMKRKFTEYDVNRYLEFEMANVGETQKKIDNADCIVINPKVEDHAKILNLCMRKGKEVILVPDMIDISIFSAETHYIDDKLMLLLKRPGLNNSQRLVKRVFDLIVALLVLIVVSPVLILLMILIPVLSPGPAIFYQERSGEGGIPFKVMKFRTMVDNAEEGTGPVLATQNDPRITKFGAFLRATRLDELPQLINVINGDMSMVGPRPERKFFIDQFKETIPYYNYRMAVKPGITGFAQVKGRYTTTPEDKLRFDLMYIKKYSFGLDLSILLETVRVVFQREKAAGVEVKSSSNVKNMVS